MPILAFGTLRDFGRLGSVLFLIHKYTLFFVRACTGQTKQPACPDCSGCPHNFMSWLHVSAGKRLVLRRFKALLCGPWTNCPWNRAKLPKRKRPRAGRLFVLVLMLWLLVLLPGVTLPNTARTHQTTPRHGLRTCKRFYMMERPSGLQPARASDSSPGCAPPGALCPWAVERIRPAQATASRTER